MTEKAGCCSSYLCVQSGGAWWQCPIGLWRGVEQAESCARAYRNHPLLAGMWVAGRLGLPRHVCDPIPLLSWEEEGVVPSRKLLWPPSYSKTGQGLPKHVRAAVAHVTTEHHGGLWSIWKRGVQRVRSRAWSPWLSLSNPASCT